MMKYAGISEVVREKYTVLYFNLRQFWKTKKIVQ